MNNLITIENTNAVVSFDTIIKFSGHTEKYIKTIIRENSEDLMQMQMSWERIQSQDTLRLPTHKSGTNVGKVDWNSITFDEKQSTYLLTLLGNSDEVKRFKQGLVHQFFSMRESISQIREKALLDTFQEEKRLAIEEANKLNDYNGFISVGKFVKEINTQVSKDVVWDALEFAGYSKHIIRSTKYRRLADDCSELVGTTIHGTTGTPVFTEVAIKLALRKHNEYLNASEEE